MLLSPWRCSCRQNNAPVDKPMLPPQSPASDWGKTVLLPPGQCSCRETNAPVDKHMLHSTWHCCCRQKHVLVDKTCPCRQDNVPVGLGQNNVPASETMLLSTQQCLNPTGAPSQSWLFPRKQSSCRHCSCRRYTAGTVCKIAPVYKPMPLAE